jgi:Lsr2
VRFAFGGADNEIDLNKKNAAAFRTQCAPFIEHARKGRARTRPPGCAPRQGVSAAAPSGSGRSRHRQQLRQQLIALAEDFLRAG